MSWSFLHIFLPLREHFVSVLERTKCMDDYIEQHLHSSLAGEEILIHDKYRTSNVEVPHNFEPEVGSLCSANCALIRVDSQ